MDDVAPERWESLRQRRALQEFIVEPVDGDTEEIMLGIDPDGRLHLLVMVATEPLGRPPDLQGFEVRVVEHDGRTWLDISARSHNEDLFTMLVNKILFAIRIEGRDPARAIAGTIEDLRTALRPVAPELTVTEQIGLFGELWVLSNVLLPVLGARGCQLWSGPHGERHDFAGVGAHVEVKTTTRDDEKHEISRLDQLRAPHGKRLLLVSVLLERSIAGDHTIADLIDQIIEKLGNDGRAIDVIEATLDRVGWNDGIRESGSLLRFTLRDVHVFEVTGTFPRLPDEYVPPRGVTSIKYTIDVAACASLSTDQVRDILVSM